MAMHYDVKERSLLYKDIDNCFVYKKHKRFLIFVLENTRHSKEISCMFLCILLLPIVFGINFCIIIFFSIIFMRMMSMKIKL